MKTRVAVLVVIALSMLGLGCTNRDGAAEQAVGAPAQVSTAADGQPAEGAPSPPAVKEIEPSEFEAEVIKASCPVVVDFFATWCGPCKRLAPVLDQIAAERVGKVKFVRVDVDKARELAMKYRIDSVPTLILFVNGEQKARWVGYRDKAEIIADLDGALK